MPGEWCNLAAVSDAPDASEFLDRLGKAGEGPHDIALAALMLASLDHPRERLEPLLSHLSEIAELARREAIMITSAQDGARVLGRLLAGHYGYDGDRLSYDDPRNGDLIEVIQRRRGLPVALGILYMHAARAVGMEAAGLDTPAHFLLVLRKKDREAIVDPFNGAAVIDPDGASAPPGLGAPLAAGLAQRVSDTDVLLRLQNNLRLRALRAGDQARALEIAARMVQIGPGRADLWLDLARLNEAMGAPGASRRAYEACLRIAKPGENLHNEAALGLAGLKRLIN